MPIVIIAVVILCILSKFFMGLRAYLCFSMFAIGLAGVIAGLFGADSLYLYGGIVGLVLSILIAFLTSLRTEASQRPRYMLRFFFYGFMTFVYVLMLAMIIFIPLAITFGRVMDNYREANLVDDFGKTIGKVYVNKDLKGPDGKQYRNHSDDAY